MTGDAHRTGGRDGKHGSSSVPGPSSSRHASKRRRLDHLQENKKNVSKFFHDGGSGNQQSQAIPSTSTSSRPSCATADAIVIDGEDDSAATNDDPHEPIVLGTSSPDPMDLISPDISYAFDQNKPSPLHQLSSTLEGIRKPPQDGESTRRVRHAVKQSEAPSSESASHLDGDDIRVQRARALPTLSGSKPTAQVGVSSEGNSVKTKVALYEQQNSPHIDLKLKATMRRSRKSVMKPKQMPLGRLASFPAPSIQRGKRLKIVFLSIYL
ncbi:hypothetical protein BJV74DRAFT_377630 [Russula compacta]|nr:hypothetical protein BJV74DRAFT_377630 [Russula compacta]